MAIAEAEFHGALATRTIGRDLCFHDSIDSTSTEARRLLERGEATHGTVVVALRQTDGRGTGGKRWVSDAPMGLWCTVVLIGGVPTPVSLVIGCAAVDALRSFGVDAHLKWPNDVLIGSRKAAGILVETASAPGGGGSGGSGGVAHLVGIGINVMQESFERELADRATSLRMEMQGSPPSIPTVFGAVMGAMEHHLAEPAPVAHRWIARTRMIDTPAEVVRGAERTRVVVRGLMADGRLVVEEESSKLKAESGNPEVGAGKRIFLAAASDMDLVWPVV